MNPLASKITGSELEVMRVLWTAKEALPIVSIRLTLGRSSEWDSSTIKTLLRRLCEKGIVLAVKKEVFYYSPLISEIEYSDSITQNMIDRLYRGSAKDMVASLVSGNRLNRQDIEELRAMFKAGGKDD
jgi:BlaI family transcriptional regulator, penicillinase repressor